MLVQSRGFRLMGLRPLVMFVGLVVLAWVGYQQVLGLFLRGANTALVSGDLVKAQSLFQRVDRMPFDGTRGQDGLGALCLVQGDVEGARTHFKEVLEAKPGRMGVDAKRFLTYLLNQGTADQATTYIDYLKNWKQEGDLAFLALEFAEAALRSQDLDGLAKALAVAEDQQSDPRYAALKQYHQTYSRDGKVPVLFDRNGIPFLHYQTGTKSYNYVAPAAFAGWVGSEKNALAGFDFHNRIQTTLDLNLQKAALAAMAGYQGTLIMTQPETGEVLAAFASEGYHPFASRFEPGSVIKVLTYGLFLESGASPAPYAPKKYPGNMMIGDKIFFDWTEQGQLNTVAEGMAVSCNLMFAQMGIELSMNRWLTGARQFFDNKPLPHFLGTSTYGGLLKDPENVWDLGRAAIGLDHLNTTSLGLVLIPMAVANRGNLPSPFIVRSVGPLEPNTRAIAAPAPIGRVFSEHVADELKVTLEKSVTFERGTARRAQVEFVKAGMKTGTSGEKPFNSVMVGLFPLDKPTIAFSLFLDKGGKCEINGSLVARRLQEQIQALAPEYLQ